MAKCPDCLSEMTRVDAPRSLSFNIPFTPIEVQILVFGAGGYDWFCHCCIGEEESAAIDYAASHAYDDGFERGYERGRRE